MLLIVYQAIVVLVGSLVAAVIMRERNLGHQVAGGLVLVLLLLRLFLIK